MEKTMLEGRIKIIKFRDNLNVLEEDIKQEIKLLKKKKIRIRTSAKSHCFHLLNDITLF